MGVVAANIKFNNKKRGYVSVSRFLLGLVLAVFVILLQSCDDEMEPYDEFEGFTKKQLEEGIQLDFSEENFLEVTRQRNEAVALNYHFKKKSDFVPALLLCGNKQLKIKVRLKGGEVDHLAGKHWSYKLKGKKILGFGHKKLAIQSPHTKNYLLEYLFHRLCKQEDLIALEYLFIPVTINDSLQSTYAMASVIGHNTLVNAGRLPGPILKFNKSDYWSEMVAGKTGIDSVCMLAAQIKSCNSKWSKKHPSVYDEAVNKLKEYRNVKLAPNEVFDYDLFSKYVAISELFGSSHNLRWLNLRLYYHHDHKRFEPIAFDCYDGPDPRNEVIWYNEEKRFEYFLHPLLDDPVFQKKVEKYLNVYCQQRYIKELFSKNHGELSKYMNLIRQDKNNYILSRDQMLKRGNYILSILK